MGLGGAPIENIISDDLHLQTCGVEVDTVRDKIYWAAVGSEWEGSDQEEWEWALYRANLDGSQVEKINNHDVECASAVDESRGKIYWRGDGALYRANLDGSQVETFLTGSYFRDVAIDEDGGKIYWTDWDVNRANLDGSQVEKINEASTIPQGIALGP